MKLTIPFFILFCLVQIPAYSHPGNTASDGCHYCRTNCDKWGVPWNARHCHNRYKESSSLQSADIFIPAIDNTTTDKPHTEHKHPHNTKGNSKEENS